MVSLSPALRFEHFQLPAAQPYALPFPLNQEKIRYYYFARNGIWDAMKIFALSPGDLVLMPALTSGIEVDVVRAYGLKPVFYNIQNDLSPHLTDARTKITERTKLFYLIHYLGFPQPLPEISQFCHTHNLQLFEDAALSFLSADSSGRPLGSTGDVGLFCPRKTAPIPHGGILLINSNKYPTPTTKLYKPPLYSTLGAATSLFLQGERAYGGFRGLASDLLIHRCIPKIKKTLSLLNMKYVETGTPLFDKSKTALTMSLVSRSLLLRFDYHKLFLQRRTNYQHLVSLLQDIPHITIQFPELPPHACPMDCMIYINKRDEVMEKLKVQNIETSKIWWWNRPREIAQPYPAIKKILEDNIVLPIHQDLASHQIETMAMALRNAIN